MSSLFLRFFLKIQWKTRIFFYNFSSIFETKKFSIFHQFLTKISVFSYFFEKKHFFHTIFFYFLSIFLNFKENVQIQQIFLFFKLLKTWNFSSSLGLPYFTLTTDITESTARIHTHGKIFISNYFFAFPAGFLCWDLKVKRKRSEYFLCQV